MKKTIVSFFVLFLIASTLLPAVGQAAERTSDSYVMFDIWGHWAEDELDDLVNADIFKGYEDEDGDYYLDPDRSITRGQFAAIIVRALGLEKTGQGKMFTDVQPSHGLYQEITIASDHGIARGREDGSFNPNAPITRDQLATMIVRAFDQTVSFNGNPKAFTDVSSDYWAIVEINKASGVGIIRGDEQNQFRPRQKASRAHAGVMLHRALNKEQSNVPDDALLTSTVLSSETESFPLFAQNDFQALFEHSQKYYTGYQKSASDEIIEGFIEESIMLSMEFIGEPTIEVLSKSNRFAQVELVGEVKMNYQDPTTTFETTLPLTSIYYMKKIDSTWKIYYTDEPFTEDELDSLN